MIRKLFFLRGITRKLGINKIVFNLIYSKKKYEQYFDNYFSTKIKQGYVVYDIGANVGFYTSIYSQLVGENGKVYAFEPSIVNYQKLQNTTNIFSNVTLFNFGIGETKMKLFLSQGEDEIGANSRLSNDASTFGNWIDIRTLDSFINDIEMPNAIKIDVEGFEIDVLKGASSILKNPKLQLIGIELHSKILNEKGIYNPEKIIEKILISNSFDFKWVDFSHIVAFR